MKVMLIGPPGSGKGTQANVLEQRFNIPQISTGDILRNELKKESELAFKLRQQMNQGELVDDDTVVSIVRSRLLEADCQHGFILDGFPRTIAQAKKLEQLGIKIDIVVELDVSRKIIVDRLSGRRIHEKSGRTYHLKYNPPIIEGLDDKTGDPLLHRSDDQSDVIQHRLSVYREQTSPLVKYYQHISDETAMPYIHIDVEEWMLKGDVTAQLLEKLYCIENKYCPY
ncbi:adenylate kinase [Vibrio lamellibrachiae]|uniref:adenylate kinase n=1 Tax=Vibrio lamellibrachiae TaxID=2910253 RepID=UPI003D1517D5